jgi:nucleoside-diphosphate-sugar epimerase
MNILITGGAGFIGSHLTETLLSQGHQVVVADNFLTGRYANLAHLEDELSLKIVEVDVSDPGTSALLPGPFDRVYHLACPASPRGYGKYPLETLLVCSAGTLNALRIAEGDQARFLLASTSEVYGDPAIHPQVESYWGNVNPNGPRSCYDEGKRFAEALTMEFVRQHGLDARLARIFNTYGPRSNPKDGRVVPNFCVQALLGEDLTIYGDGSQTRSFCYVDDLVRGLILLMETDGLAGEVVNLGNPHEFTMIEFAEEVLRLTGSTSDMTFEPLPTDDPLRRQPNIDKAHRLLGWNPEATLEDGLRSTLDYFEECLLTI